VDVKGPGTRNLSEDEVPRYGEWMEDAERLNEIVQALQELLRPDRSDPAAAGEPPAAAEVALTLPHVVSRNRDPARRLIPPSCASQRLDTP
jgi:hypothetical protein